MNYWLIKSEPDVWSIEQQKKAGIKGAAWDGVRNYQAANNLRSMKLGDLCFFYHSNIGKEIVGIVEVIKEAFPDKTDKKKKFVAVQVRFTQKLKSPVSLVKIKRMKRLLTRLTKRLKILFQIKESLLPKMYHFDMVCSMTLMKTLLS